MSNLVADIKTIRENLLANVGPDELAVRDGQLVRLARRGDRSAIEPITEAFLTVLAAGVSAKGSTPSSIAIRGILADDPWPDLPTINELATTPFVRADGTVVSTRGLHGTVWLEPGELTGLGPTMTTTEALGSIENYLSDFPFESAADRSAAIATMVTPLVRQLYQGPTPIFAITATVQGTGKTLLAKLIGAVVSGEEPAPMSASMDDDDELRKTIVAVLSEGERVLLLDNIVGEIGPASMAVLATSDTFRGRILGQSRMLRLPNRGITLLTANNPTFNQDMIRRVLPIRLAYDGIDPTERSTFRHSNVVASALADRWNIIDALLSLYACWNDAGRPAAACPPMATYEGWRESVGGIMCHAGRCDFLDGIERTKAFPSDDEQDLRAFITHWSKQFGGGERTASSLADLARTADLWQTIRGSSKNQADEVRRIGREMATAVGRRFPEGRIERRLLQGRTMYRIEKGEAK